MTESHERALRPSFIAAVFGVLLACLLTGTAAGAPGDVTVSQVADINVGPDNSNPEPLTNVNGTLFFVADDGMNGAEIWKSEAPYTTVTMVADIYPGATGSAPQNLTNYNGTLFFSAGDPTNGVELWKSNGGPLGPGGTEMVADINPTTTASSFPGPLTNVNGTLFFSANDGVNGVELWRSNGGPVGPGGDTVMVSNNTNPNAAANTAPDWLTNVNNTVFFAGSDSTNGRELWKSVPPYSTAAMVANINPASNDSVPTFLTNVNGTLFFAASNGANGNELWKSDGGPLGMGTEMVADINTAGNSFPQKLTNVNNTLFFQATDGTNGVELWKSNGGTAMGDTVMVADINPVGGDSFPDALFDFNGTLFFMAIDGTNGFELWKSNGGALGPGGTEMVANINPLGGSSFPSFFTNFNGILLFRADDGSFGTELWRTGGTLATTTRVSDIAPGSQSSSPTDLTEVNGTLFFSANDLGAMPATGRELWRATIEGPAPPVVTPPATLTPTTPAAPKKKKCKKTKKRGKKGTAAAKKCKKRKK